jgi:CysZ protein
MKEGMLIFRDDVKTADSFFGGAAATFKAFGIVRAHAGLVKYFIIPFAINIILLSAVFYFSFTMIYDPLIGLVHGSAWYNRVLEVILAPLLVFALGIIIVFLYSIAGSVITAPFNDFLSQKVEEMLTGVRFDEKLDPVRLLKDVVRIISSVIRLLLLVLGINLVLLLLNLVPGAGSVIYAACSFLTASFFFGFQFFDFPLERRRYDFRQKLSIAWRFKRTVAGVGASFFIMTFIPVVGFLGMNMATVAAAKLFIDRIRPALRLVEGRMP